MRSSLTISGILHVGAVLMIVNGLPFLSKQEVPLEQPLIVELVKIADETTPQDKKEKIVDEKSNTVFQPPRPPKRADFVAPMPLPKSPPEAKRQSEPAIKVPPAPNQKKKQEVAFIPSHKPKLVPISGEKSPEIKDLSHWERTPQPFSKPTPPSRRFDAVRLAALLDKSTKKDKRRPDVQKEAADKAREDDASKARYNTKPLTMSEIDSIRYQLEQCWTIPAGARNAKELVVRIKIFLNPDGSVSRPPIIVNDSAIDRLRMTADDDYEFFLAAAKSARRAVLQCTPLRNLPPEKFRYWREIIMKFNPRNMLGG